MDICLFGPQGSGKGTQGKLLSKEYDLKPFVMGDQLRATIASGSTLGQKIKSIVDSGELVDDGTIMEMVEVFLKSLSKTDKVLFDGIPRTMNQSEELLRLLESHGRDVFGLLIHISEEKSIERLTKRRICPNCNEIYPAFYHQETCQNCRVPLMSRQDDSNLESINKRLENYKNQTLPVVDDFKKRDHLISIDGEQDIEEVTSEMMEKTQHLFK